VAKDSIPKSKIPDALDALRALGAKELDDIPARAAIKKMRRQIERVLRLGYSYEEVSKTLAPLDINISPERIRYLLNDIRRSTRKKSVTPPSEENTSTQVIDEALVSENSEITESNTEPANKPQSQSEPKSKSASSKSTTSKTPKTAKKTSDVKAPENQNPSRLAFVPEIISDEDL
jgi:(p)ppGpp synthase/HD superfamily hydrolase